MRIVLEYDDLCAAVEMYVRQAMGVEYADAVVRFPYENQEWNCTVEVGEAEEGE